jgi:hypothetical protein
LGIDNDYNENILFGGILDTPCTKFNTVGTKLQTVGTKLDTAGTKLGKSSNINDTQRILDTTVTPLHEILNIDPKVLINNNSNANMNMDNEYPCADMDTNTNNSFIDTGPPPNMFYTPSYNFYPANGTAITTESYASPFTSTPISNTESRAITTIDMSPTINTPTIPNISEPLPEKRAKKNNFKICRGTGKIIKVKKPPIIDGNENLSSNSSLSFLTELVTSILDFSPTEGSCLGGEKILICLKSPLIIISNIYVSFGGVEVPCDVLTPTVIRCYSPPLSLSIDLKGCHLWLTTQDGHVLSTPSIDTFEYINLPLNSDVEDINSYNSTEKENSLIIENKIHIENKIINETNNDLMLNSNKSFDMQKIAQNEQEINQIQILPLQLFSIQNFSVDTREHKIRIVERLSNFNCALKADIAINTLKSDILTENRNDQYSTNNSCNDDKLIKEESHIDSTDSKKDLEDLRFTIDAKNEKFNDERFKINNTHIKDEKYEDDNTLNDDGVPEQQWLDDTQLALLSTNSLQLLMDQYLLSVVTQLVQLASVDDDLRIELDALDSSGLSLLHYCCLYNLTALVPLLLDRRADITQRTSEASGPPVTGDPKSREGIGSTDTGLFLFIHGLYFLLFYFFVIHCWAVL